MLYIPSQMRNYCSEFIDNLFTKHIPYNDRKIHNGVWAVYLIYCDMFIILNKFTFLENSTSGINTSVLKYNYARLHFAATTWPLLHATCHA